MKFITEEELRDLYKIQPFTDYDLPEGERLTPGARQFLLDRGIDLYDRNDPFANLTKEKAVGTKPAKPLDERRKRLLHGKMRTIQTSFLLTVKELLEIDPIMAQQLTVLCRQFAAMDTVPDGACEVADLMCKPCTGINEENFCDACGECFAFTEFHMQMPKSKQMLLLGKLRDELEIFDIETEELISDGGFQKLVSGKLNQIINTLSQMICGAMGGSECQRTE